MYIYNYKYMYTHMDIICGGNIHGSICLIHGQYMELCTCNIWGNLRVLHKAIYGAIYG
jgi:hypothetical protein